MWALGRAFAKEVDAKTITAGLADTSELVQIQTLHVLERRQSAAWIPQVQPLTHDPRWQVNEEAHDAIKVMRGGKRTDHLKTLPEWRRHAGTTTVERTTNESRDAAEKTARSEGRSADL